MPCTHSFRSNGGYTDARTRLGTQDIACRSDRVIPSCERRTRRSSRREQRRRDGTHDLSRPLVGIGTAASRTYSYVTTHTATVWARVVERRRAVALARHYREAEGLSILQIADRLGRSPATVKAYFYDPNGEKARAVKARYQGVCRGCGAYTQPRNGKGDAYAYCKACHPGAVERRWTRDRVDPTR